MLWHKAVKSCSTDYTCLMNVFFQVPSHKEVFSLLAFTMFCQSFLACPKKQINYNYPVSICFQKFGKPLRISWSNYCFLQDKWCFLDNVLQTTEGKAAVMILILLYVSEGLAVHLT